MPAKSLRTRIEERAAEKDSEGMFANPSLEDLHDAAHGTPMKKRRKGRTSLTKSATDEASANASRVRVSDRRGFKEALQGSASPSSLRKEAVPADSPAAAMVGNLGNLLTVFRDSEGRDPDISDTQFWSAFRTVIRDGLGLGESE